MLWWPLIYCKRKVSVASKYAILIIASKHQLLQSISCFKVSVASKYQLLQSISCFKVCNSYYTQLNSVLTSFSRGFENSDAHWQKLIFFARILRNLCRYYITVCFLQNQKSISCHKLTVKTNAIVIPSDHPKGYLTRITQDYQATSDEEMTVQKGIMVKVGLTGEAVIFESYK